MREFFFAVNSVLDCCRKKAGFRPISDGMARSVIVDLAVNLIQLFTAH